MKFYCVIRWHLENLWFQEIHPSPTQPQEILYFPQTQTTCSFQWGKFISSSSYTGTAAVRSVCKHMCLGEQQHKCPERSPLAWQAQVPMLEPSLKTSHVEDGKFCLPQWLSNLCPSEQTVLDKINSWLDLQCNSFMRTHTATYCCRNLTG